MVFIRTFISEVFQPYILDPVICFIYQGQFDLQFHLTFFNERTCLYSYLNRLILKQHLFLQQTSRFKPLQHDLIILNQQIALKQIDRYKLPIHFLLKLHNYIRFIWFIFQNSLNSNLFILLLLHQLLNWGELDLLESVLLAVVNDIFWLFFFIAEYFKPIFKLNIFVP